MHHVSAQGVDERMLNAHLKQILLLLLLQQQQHQQQ